MLKRLQILGTRGIPASHGGFETFAEDLALHLVGRGWKVTVYCQVDAKGGEKEIVESEWQGVRLVHVPIGTPGALGTVFFDWKSTWHAAARGELVLTLGYNTALFCAIHRLRGVRNVINMDGLEWKRTKYGFAKRAWMYVNEWLGAWFGQRLVADHPEIARHLESRTRVEKIVTIPYGARAVEQANVGKLAEYGLEAGRYALVIARPEPENNILEIVRAYSRRKRGMPLVVLGNYEVEGYPARVREVAGKKYFSPRRSTRRRKSTRSVSSAGCMYMGTRREGQILRCWRRWGRGWRFSRMTIPSTAGWRGREPGSSRTRPLAKINWTNC
ncbi:MAG: DUF1972 domain-containing protein [Planctomycetota bacterium]